MNLTIDQKNKIRIGLQAKLKIKKKLKTRFS